MFVNTIYLKVKGKNIERFLKRLNNKGIELLKIEKIKYNEIIIEIKKEDYDEVNNIKTIYEIDIIGIHGLDYIKSQIIKKRYILFSFLLSIILFLILSNTIFSVEVIHNEEEIRTLLIEELDSFNIKKYKRKKSYKELQEIKEKILEKYKDKIEWLEIETHGTKYVVRVEERILTEDDNNYVKRNIVAKKDAMLLIIDAKSGEVLKTKNSFVKKGETVISGNIYLFEDIKNSIMAEGKIYGEVWYKATVEYPLNYKEETLTGKVKKVFSFNFLNKDFSIFDFHKYKFKNTEDINKISHLFLPISFGFQKQYEKNVIEESLTKDEATFKAIKKATEKIESKLKDKEYIIATKKLKVEENYSKIVVELFFTVCEDITDYEEIIEE
jgi:similar to stage IV sporulation protein